MGFDRRKVRKLLCLFDRVAGVTLPLLLTLCGLHVFCLAVGVLLRALGVG